MPVNYQAILGIVMPFCDSSTVSAIMKTCRALHSEGISFLLAHGVVMEDERDIKSFIAFARAEGGRRLAYLKELTVTAPSLSRPIATALSLFLSQYANLLIIETLRIDHADTHVVTLEVSESGATSAKFLRALDSKLEHAELNMIPPSPDEDRPDGPQDYNCIKLLQHSQNTLTRLSGSAFELMTPWETPTYSQVYPHVEKLCLYNNDGPVTIVYAHAFPNTRFFRYDTSAADMEVIGTSFEEHVLVRNMNIIQQIELNSPWRDLEACHASLIDLFLLGLQCHVRRLHVMGNFMQPSHLRTVMMDTTPEYMCLQGYDVNILTKGLTNTMKQPYAQQLRALEVVLMVGGVLGPAAVDMPRVVEGILDMLRPLKIRSFGLFIVCCLAPPRRLRNSSLCPAERYLADLDIDAFALRIKDTTPTLQSVVVVMRMHRARPDTTVTIGADVEYGPDAVEAIALQSALMYLSLPPLYPEAGGFE
ncbi:hypothetical protein L226DRAFT_617224 [Lentinus tigrinus ALCF2SS1-7]|uniref:F-box domain-containing protein n=1 Tax=Lentinus tigrinus ALCF2SS1-6 TaxID=1328759 RepID=A0A5C2RRB1_9APHY|nr:hypothetical protein L227DRAFT_657792 [Lentinus tigrinus ALCF2SS1-6]RPD68867.1 hypothetical protein L226DRAFT_617224 [Lentinus tigrinus ALCF2SS1-7]